MSQATRWFTDRNIAAKVLTAVALGALVAIAVGLLGLSKMGQMSAETDALYNQNVVPLTDLANVRASGSTYREAVLKHLVTTDDAEMSALETQLTESKAQFDEDLTVYQAKAADPDATEEYRTAWSEYQRVTEDAVLPLSRENRAVEASAVRAEQLDPLAVRTAEAAGAMIDAESAQALDRLDSAHALNSSARTTSVILILAGVALALAVGFVIARLISSS